MENLTLPSIVEGAFGQALPGPTLGTFAVLLSWLDDVYTECLERNALGPALAFMVAQYPAAYPIMRTVCRACAMQARGPVDVEPWTAFEALARVRFILDWIETNGITVDVDPVAILKNGESVNPAAHLEAAGGRGPSGRLFDWGLSGEALYASAGIVRYAIGRTLSTGVPCLAEAEKLQTAAAVLLDCIHRGDGGLDWNADRWNAVWDLAGLRADEDVRSGAPDPFEPDPLTIDLTSLSEAP